MAQQRLSDAAKRRVRAGRMLLARKRPAEVVTAVGLARKRVYGWKGLLDDWDRCVTPWPESSAIGEEAPLAHVRAPPQREERVIVFIVVSCTNELPPGSASWA